MINKFTLTLSFLIATTSFEVSCSSPWEEAPWELSVPPAPRTTPTFSCPPPMATFPASPYRNSASTTTTVAHGVSPLSTLEESMPRARTNNSVVRQISNTRYQARNATAAELSPNWREESIFDANGNAEQTSLVKSKNELAFEKTYFAAALRAMKSEQSNKSITPTHSSKATKQAREEAEIQEIAQLRKDSRSPLGDREFWS